MKRSLGLASCNCVTECVGCATAFIASDELVATAVVKTDTEAANTSVFVTTVNRCGIGGDTTGSVSDNAFGEACFQATRHVEVKLDFCKTVVVGSTTVFVSCELKAFDARTEGVTVNVICTRYICAVVFLFAPASISSDAGCDSVPDDTSGTIPTTVVHFGDFVVCVAGSCKCFTTSCFVSVITVSGLVTFVTSFGVSTTCGLTSFGFSVTCFAVEAVCVLETLIALSVSCVTSRLACVSCFTFSVCGTTSFDTSFGRSGCVTLESIATISICGAEVSC